MTERTTDLVAAAEAVAAVAADHADEAERARRLPAVTVDALVAAGLMRMAVPAVYGGPEADPLTMLAAFEAVARGDGAAGWCTMIAATSSSQSLFLAPDTAREIFGDPSSIAGGVAAPNGAGTIDGDTITVTGRWAWGSGTQHCDWILGGTRCDDGAFRFCWFPARDVTFHDTWYSSGLRGTGSLDFSVAAAAVPLRRTVVALQDRPVVDVPLAAFPNITLLAASVASVSLGIARRALDEITVLAAVKRPQFSSRTLAESGYTHLEVARAEAALRAARAFLHDEVGQAWATVTSGDRVDLARRVGIRLAAVHAAARAAEATTTAYTLAGGSSVYESSVLQRCLRDVHVPTQHIQVAPKLDATLGRLLLGQDADTSML